MKNPAKEVKVSYFKFLAAGKNFQANLIICLAIIQQNNHPDEVNSKVVIAYHLVNNAILIIGLQSFKALASASLDFTMMHE